MRRFDCCSIRFLAVIPFILLAARPAAAHFVWVDMVNVDGKPAARVMFGEAAGPGEPHLLSKIAQTRNVGPIGRWFVDRPEIDRSGRREDTAAYWASLPPTLWPWKPPVTMAFTRGHRAACGCSITPNAWPRAPPHCRSQQSVENGDRANGERRTTRRHGTFGWQTGCQAELIAVDEDGQASELKLDADARAVVELPKSGRLALRAKHAVDRRVGRNRRPEIWPNLVLRHARAAGLEKVAGRADSRRSTGPGTQGTGDLAARLSRFTTDLPCAATTAALDARAKIDPQAWSMLSGDRSPLHDWAEQQLQSLVQHRMPDGEVAEGNVTFVAEPVAHPLGRLIDLGDAERQSRYRLKTTLLRRSTV